MLTAVFDALFASDSLVYTPDPDKPQEQVVLRVGDKVSVYSNRFNTWLHDGHITATYRTSIRVSYGLDRYFGLALTRGNSKTVPVTELKEIVRPVKLCKIKKL